MGWSRMKLTTALIIITAIGYGMACWQFGYEAGRIL